MCAVCGHLQIGVSFVCCLQSSENRRLFFVSRTHRTTTVLLECLFSKQLYVDAILSRNVGPRCFYHLFTTVSLDPESHILDQYVASRRHIARCENCLFLRTFCTTIPYHLSTSKTLYPKTPYCHAESVTIIWQILIGNWLR